MINSDNTNAQLAGTISMPLTVANKVNWSTSSSQTVSYVGDALGPKEDVTVIYSNRAVQKVVTQKHGVRYFIKPAKGKRIQVKKIDDVKYEVVL